MKNMKQKEKGWNKTIEEIFSPVKEMASNTVERKKEESSEATGVGLSRSGGSKGEDVEVQEKMDQLLRASQGDQKIEDGWENVEHDLSGSQGGKKKNEASRENEEKDKKREVRKDENQRLNEKEDKRKRKVQKRAKNRSRSKDFVKSVRKKMKEKFRSGES